MTTLEIAAVIVAFPFAVAAGAWLGRRFQRMHWRLDLPYEERVRLLNKSRNA
jgi:hypothetical protein